LAGEARASRCETTTMVPEPRPARTPMTFSSVRVPSAVRALNVSVVVLKFVLAAEHEQCAGICQMLCAVDPREAAGAEVNDHLAVIGQRFAQRVAVLLGPQLSQHRQNQRAAAQLGAKVLENVGFDSHVLCDTYCTWHTVWRTVQIVKRNFSRDSFFRRMVRTALVIQRRRYRLKFRTLGASI